MTFIVCAMNHVSTTTSTGARGEKKDTGTEYTNIEDLLLCFYVLLAFATTVWAKFPFFLEQRLARFAWMAKLFFACRTEAERGANELATRWAARWKNLVVVVRDLSEKFLFEGELLPLRDRRCRSCNDVEEEPEDVECRNDEHGNYSCE